MRLTEEQMQKKLLEKVQKDYNDFLDSLLDGDREMLGNNVQELSIKRDMLLEFEYFPPLDGDNLKAILRKSIRLIIFTSSGISRAAHLMRTFIGQ